MRGGWITLVIAACADQPPDLPRFEPGIIVECAAPVVPLDCSATPVVDTESLLDETR